MAVRIVDVVPGSHRGTIEVKFKVRFGTLMRDDTITASMFEQEDVIIKKVKKKALETVADEFFASIIQEKRQMLVDKEFSVVPDLKKEEA